MFLTIIKKRNFRNFFFSDIISGFGVGMSFIGANWFLMDQTNSLQSLGFMLSLNVIAGFLVFPYVGTITDKYNRKTIIFWAHLVRAIVILGVCSTFLFSGFKIEFLYLLAILNGIGWTVYMSASRSLIQELLSEEDLINGNSLIEISLQVGMFMAAAVSGFSYAFFGFWLILLINAMVFLISTIFLIRIKYTPISAEDKEETFYVNFKKGLTYLKERPSIFLLGVAAVS
jgi:MFS family permease